MPIPSWYSVTITFFHLSLLVPIDPAKRYIYLQLLGGKAFLEHLQDPEALPGQIFSTFTVHAQFMGQRYQSRPVPCACEPAIEEGSKFIFFFGSRFFNPI